MSNVVPLAPASRPAKVASECHPTLRRWGRRLAWLFTVLLGLGAMFAICVLGLGLACGGAFLWLAPGAAYVGFAPADTPGLVPFGDLPWPTRWAYAATFALDFAPALAILVELRGLALTYTAGIAFGPAAAGHLRRVGLWLVAYAFAPALGHGLVLLAGHGVDLAWLHASSFQALVLASLLVALTEVMRVGHAIQSDRDGFV